ncbi:protein kinase [Microcoleus sp. PH2017_30_WIL_O_A]|uniref:protein kinase domain-containing protein n=1 Tax=Microcoleus sp. PH2017_30_WIL_O_A TaxID=2798840 RepID=UPI001D4A2BAC|nr:protein kinase [Microcoleus sp. PH2017_30_WIL_O_A]MCC3582672.1 protein kinase [Microcoleus sp. PH2017_30_WIL_O_A]
MDSLDEQMLGEESVSYCINPKCQQRQNPYGSETCLACDTPLLINNRYRAVRMLHQSDRTEIFELEDLGFGEAGWDIPKILKVLTDDSNLNLVRLFQQEELILRQLKHLKIPQVFPGGYFTFEASCRVKVYCLAMEQIQGKNLEQWLTESEIISEKQAIDWLKQLTKTLGCVHGRGFFHRDIKPSNIMCRPDGSLVLIDFGTARYITSDTYIDKYENCNTTLIISPGYTPPEQEKCAAIPKSDLFALGRTFVHLLTCRHPDSLAKTATGELIWRQLAPQISVDMADLIDEMMSVNSELRPQNPSTVLQRLAQIECEHLTVSKFFRQVARKINFIYPNIQLNHRNYSLVGLGVSVSLFLGITAFKSLAPQWVVSLNNCAADHYTADKLERSQFCLNLALFLDPNLGESHYIQGLIFEKNRDFHSARNSYEISIKNIPDKSLNNLARLDILEKQYSNAIPRLQRGLQLVKEVDSKSALHKNMGWALLEIGDYQQAEIQLNSAIALDSDRASAYCLLGRVREAQKDSNGAFTAWHNCLRYAPNEKYQPELDKWVIEAKNRLEVQGNDGVTSIQKP